MKNAKNESPTNGSGTGFNKNSIKTTISSDEIQKHLDEIGQEKANSFPIGVFPSEVQKVINETVEHLAYNQEYISASILSAISVRIGNNYKLIVTNGWEMRCNLIIALIGAPGTGKSHPPKFALKPEQIKDSNIYKNFEKEFKEYNRVENLTAEQRKSEGITLGEQPVLKTTIVNDTTIEALYLKMYNNNKGCLLYIDELIGWIKGFNKYSKGSDQERYLEIWGNIPTTIERTSKPPIRIENPFLSILGTMQPGILHEIVKNNRGENGFIERMLFVFPNNQKRPYYKNSDLPKEIINSYYDFINSIPQRDEEQILIFDDELVSLYNDFRNKNTNKYENDETQIIIKLEAYVLKFMIIIHVINNPTSNVIQKDSFYKAIELFEYFFEQALKVDDILSDVNGLKSFDKKDQNFFHLLPEKFTTQQALEKAKILGYSERTFYKKLKDFQKRNVLKKQSKGHYYKT